MAKFPKIKVKFKGDDWRRPYVVHEGITYRAREIYDSSRRQIVIRGLVVVKIESPFASQGAQEVEIWKKEKKTRAGEYLVPLLDYKMTEDFHYVVQPYVKLIKAKSRISRAKIREIRPIIEYLVEEYSMCDLDEEDPGWNWGLRKSDKKPVIFDYGA